MIEIRVMAPFRLGVGMKRVLLTGMSATGKSSIVSELAARGYKAVDLDNHEFSEWVAVTGAAGGSSSPAEPDFTTSDWVWREERVQRLLSDEQGDLLFVSGCASNQVKFYVQFDHIVLLSAPARLIVERLTTRATNPYGREPEEQARILRLIETVEPALRQAASLEVDTSVPMDQVIDTILGHVRP